MNKPSAPQQGLNLAEMLMGAMQNSAAQGGNNPLAAFGGLEDLLNPTRARRTNTRSGNATDALGGLLGTLFGGRTRRYSTGTGMGSQGMMAVGALAMQFLQRWLQQSQQAPRAPQSAPRSTPNANGWGAAQQAPTGGQRIPIPAPYGNPAPAQGAGGGMAGTGTADMGWPDALNAPAQPQGSRTSTPQWDAAPAAAPAATAAPAGPSETLLLLLEAMVNAAKADGNMDDNERQNIVNAMCAFIPTEDIDACITPLLQKPVDPKALAARVQDIEQAKDIYRLSCAAIDVDSFMERAYLDGLGDALYLPPDVRTQLEAEARAMQNGTQMV